MIKLSVVKKLGNIKSWSLEAINTCPGSKDNHGNTVDACKVCYASKGRYRFGSVKATRQNNYIDWKRDDWVSDMVEALDNDRFFRWFDSGDIFHPELAKKILVVCQRTPWVSHWIPTRSHKFPKIRTYLEQLNQLQNVCVRYSSDSIVGEYNEEHGSIIIDDETIHAIEGVYICPASQQHGTCQKCRACWDKTVPVVAYRLHGVSQKKRLQLKQV
ncbi:hypothetical protein H0A36_17620 [Endozoicomonas sp. SM1973]|uniref:Gene product 88 domain-containing protein n=1 Tax=Spartinivicinus marinus TaxID=2994442 RepID=A0A853IJK6_9GAMM|nr:hypothetical protein [Spartinivicinus marinus]MCX4030193.1 hypothetical protein [Spartinivicinus marinus]NYZ67836.1 hypothetical protein [Spartinivicinus marinus]